MKKQFLLFTIILLLSAVFQLSAVNLKMASILPEGSEWDNALKEMASEWKKISEGRVNVKIYPGGIAGGESDVIRKMRIGQIDMAVLTQVGIAAILPDTFAMSMPFMVETEEELDFIVEEVTPLFDQDFLDKGFVMLTWSKSGWVNFFSKDRMIEPADVMEMKFAGSVTQPELADTFRRMGMNIISIDTPDMLMALQSGMVEAFYAPTMAAASYQWFGIADEMLDLKVAPVLGGIVISERAWRKIPSKYKEELISAADNLSAHFYDEAVVIEREALRVMKDNGLNINRPSAETWGNWRAMMGTDFSLLVGDNALVSTESFNKVYSMLEEFRSR
ncbi:MAG: TRAP transporter substrate-binding protein DctP [Spirochaetales bacterium]|uniref:TRAP transporter substrate-binding protein DctP n=1 Tax=Candidatus Thalassospirochaeta sargassi TaxID=3119039 RepID=A0AAJ1MK98_9SPIO|nr:TRAP transporter substrate-binding protein DctP [Spirochaetales bacterium]